MRAQLEAMGFITTDQAVEMTGYHIEHIRDLLRSGKVEAVKLTPRTWLVKRESLLHYKETTRMGRPRKVAGNE